MINAYFSALDTLVQPIRADNWEQTLDPMHRLLDALDNPQQHYRSIVVTGSTGKGTTCLRIAQALAVSGLRVGLYTSPHLHLFRERFAILDKSSEAFTQMITRSEFITAAQPTLDAIHSLDHRYSTFEGATAMALHWFAQQKIDAAVLEVGIGGRFDAVNAVANDLAVFTPIEAEHIAMLGGSLESVAWHKAGVIQSGGKAISVAQTPEVWAILEREAGKKGASLNVYNDLRDGIGRGGFEIRPYKMAAEQTSLPGRLERITVSDRRVIIDGGHTAAAARHLREFIGNVPSLRLIIGMLRDKDVAAYVSAFDTPNVHIVYTRAPAERAIPPQDLLTRYHPSQASVSLQPSLDKALVEIAQADEAVIVVAGSLRMAAAAREAFGLLSPDDLEEARRTRAIFDGADYQTKLR